MDVAHSVNFCPGGKCRYYHWDLETDLLSFYKVYPSLTSQIRVGFKETAVCFYGRAVKRYWRSRKQASHQ